MTPNPPPEIKITVERVAPIFEVPPWVLDPSIKRPGWFGVQRWRMGYRWRQWRRAGVR